MRSREREEMNAGGEREFQVDQMIVKGDVGNEI